MAEKNNETDVRVETVAWPALMILHCTLSVGHHNIDLASNAWEKENFAKLPSPRVRLAWPGLAWAGEVIVPRGLSPLRTDI